MLEDGNMTLIDEPHHRPSTRIVSHSLSNLVVYVHVLHGLGGLPDIQRFLK